MKQQKITIPNSLDDLRLDQWQQIHALSSQEDVSGDFYTRRVLSIVYGVDHVIQANLPLKLMDEMIQGYEETIRLKPVFRQRFTLNGIEYGFIPNLEEISFGEFVDLDSNQKPEDYHKLLSILYRPIEEARGKTYSIRSYEGTHDGLRDMPLGIALGAVTFFLTLGEQLISDILRSLREEQPEILKSALEKSGVGMPQLMSSQKGISSVMETLQALPSIRPSLN